MHSHDISLGILMLYYGEHLKSFVSVCLHIPPGLPAYAALLLPAIVPKQPFQVQKKTQLWPIVATALLVPFTWSVLVLKIKTKSLVFLPQEVFVFPELA